MHRARQLFLRWRAMWKPDMYHGWGRQRGYFEGWYFKLVDPAERTALAIIPGIAMEADGKSHAFVQILDGKACKAYYHTYPAEDFRPEQGDFALQLGDNFFSRTHLRLALPNLQGELTLRELHPWPRMLGAPGIMGWYSFVPFMECYHGVVSMHHRLAGRLTLNGQAFNFDDGLGYAEKDWGRSFPSSWIWMQTNHFDHPRPVSLMISVARIPWLSGHFVGFIGGFLFEGEIYRFATYNNSKLQTRLIDNGVELSLDNGRYRLEVTGRQGAAGELLSPLVGKMVGKLNESLQATLDVRFYRRDVLLFAGQGRHAGLELAGPVQSELISDNSLEG